MRIVFPRRWIVHALIVFTGLASVAGRAQTPARPAGGPLFTGATSVLDAKDVSAGRRRFEAGARSYWHSHERGQLLYVESGRLWTGRRGQARRELGPGESDYTGPNVEHWHGAAGTEPAVQINVGFGGATNWLEAVTDQEYGK